MHSAAWDGSTSTRDCHRLLVSAVREYPLEIVLIFLPAAAAETPDVPEALADIEQCAAIALALGLSEDIRRALTGKH